ncbi:hypothetical protein RJ639_015613 [Escallonia herrerae]|uniref:Uncharacterized protein n=1 Tax=Escallonia herrerae TaxID=1293975 RepID=A0AA88VCG5_9ASTE|nr:hypothetical protein RJ639_015613 [Escallonia herrerae]
MLLPNCKCDTTATGNIISVASAKGTGSNSTFDSHMASSFQEGAVGMPAFPNNSRDAVLDLEMIIITLVLPKFMVSFAGNYEKTLLGAVLLLQYVPRLYRFLHSFSAQYPSGFILESTWKTSIINLFGFGLSGHVVGSCWYIFGLQRVVQCLQDACHSSGMDNCQRFIDCRQANYVPKFESDSTRESWKRNENVTACFSEGGYSGIYVQAVNLTRERNPVTRYAYSFFWGFQNLLQSLSRSRNFSSIPCQRNANGPMLGKAFGRANLALFQSRIPKPAAHAFGVGDKNGIPSPMA